MLENPDVFVRENFDRAIAEQQIKVYYQPEIRTITRRICGFEALARWIDPVEGMISPGEFIPVLEEQNRIHELDLYIIRTVCAGQRRILDTGLPLTHTSVNLSRKDFTACDIFAEVEAIRKEYNIEIEFLNIEITESALSENNEHINETIKKFRDAGYQVWMDDFGSAYSSLNNLKDYDFDFLKIDMGFLRDFDKTPKSRVILAAIVNMAKQLGVHTLAEGVETQEQYEFLNSIGCEKLQGFLFGKPEPMNENIMAGLEEPQDIENAADEVYYNKIGKVNVLSYFPLHEDKRTYDIMNSQALYIIEEDKDGYISYLYTNKAYRSFLAEAGFADINDSLYRINQDPHGLEHDFRKFLNKCAQSKAMEAMDFVYDGRLCNIKARLLVSDSSRGSRSFALTLINLSEFTTLRRAKNIDYVLNHMMSIYSRIDLFYEDGLAENIFMEMMNEDVVENRHWDDSYVEKFAEHHIVEGERASFKEFYDIKTIGQRAKISNKDHVTGLFHSYDETGNIILRMYVLIPFRMNSQNMVLSCIRNVDGLEVVGAKSFRDDLLRLTEKGMANV